MTNPLISIVIVNWNGKRFLPDCLGSLSRVSYIRKEILFVDNASTDGSVAYVKKHFPTIRIFENSKNLGFAQGHEIAFNKAKGEAVLLLNTDTIVKKDLLSKLVKALYQQENIGAVQPKILMYPEKDCIDSIGSFFSMSGILYHYGRGKDHKLPIYNKQMEIYSAKGVCILFRRKVLLKTGFFDKDYFAYFEETDLCHRIWLAGYKILYIPTTTVYHKGGGAAKQINYAYILFHSYKNRLCTYIKNLSLGYVLQVIPQALLLYLLAFIFYLGTGKVSQAWAVPKAIFWNVAHLPATLQKRRYVQTNIRKVTDKVFLPKLTRKVRLAYYLDIYLGRVKYYRD